MPKNWSDVQGEWQKKTLTHAESAFIEASNTGKPCRLFHQRKIPPLEAPTEKYSINAQLISDAILCSREDDQRDTRSFTIEGADIIGNINLSEHEIDSNLTLINCFIYGDILLNGSRLKSIYLASCHFRGISALHLTIARDTHIMRCTSTRSLKFNHTKSNGNFHLQNLIIENTRKEKSPKPETVALDLSGAQVKGIINLERIDVFGEINIRGTEAFQIACINAHVHTVNGDAISLVAARIKDSLILTNVKSFGKIDVSGAQLGGQLNCSYLTLKSAQQNPDPSKHFTQDRLVFAAQFTNVTMGFRWIKVNILDGDVTLNSAKIGDLEDDPISWNFSGDLRLDGFEYNRIVTENDDIEFRLEWLEKGSVRKEILNPQPFTHFAKVLRETGRDSDAKKTLIHREKLYAEQYRISLSKRIERSKNKPVAALCIKLLQQSHKWLLNWPLEKIIGYGYKPERSIYSLIIAVFVAYILAIGTWHEGSFTPNSAPILVSPEWQSANNSTEKPALFWTMKGQAGEDWETFYSIAYAFDLVVPLIELGQTEAWVPSTVRGPWGTTLWWMRWVLSVAGWIISALGAATITGIVTRRD